MGLRLKFLLFLIQNYKKLLLHSFDSQGWNKDYPFNTGDLIISMNVLYNYLEANNRIPWEDLRYLFGEIMYGGHITGKHLLIPVFKQIHVDSLYDQ